jgi:hypothetical protein
MVAGAVGNGALGSDGVNFSLLAKADDLPGGTAVG